MVGAHFLGIDVGSSSVKVAVLDAETGKLIAQAQSPETEMEISAPQAGWAEQDPASWWENLVLACRKIQQSGAYRKDAVAGIGISYQMHGLVLVDRDGQPVRPSIIWCDSRATPIGEGAASTLGADWCRTNLLNSPGNFTAAKAGWVSRNEPKNFARAESLLLPGDYIAFRLSGERCTTESGLSEGILWNFREGRIASELLQALELKGSLIPKVVPTFGLQGVLTAEAAAALGLPAGIPISYRAGDQPNNAFSLAVLNPGEVAATAGTSGVIYGVTASQIADPLSRVNTFLHVNHTAEQPRAGVLLCLNGCGILNAWLRKLLSSKEQLSYEALNGLAQAAPAGSDGLLVYPFGNGSERTLCNQLLGASFEGLDLTRHTTGHLARAVQEGIVFALNYGLEIMRPLGVSSERVRAGYANLFLSPLFREIFATVTNSSVELFSTDGALGAARGAAVGTGFYGAPEEAFIGMQRLEVVEPSKPLRGQYSERYGRWLEGLAAKLK